MYERISKLISKDGFAIVENVFANEEIEAILSAITGAPIAGPSFRKSSDLFAIRQFLKEVPDAINAIFNDVLKALVGHVFGDEFFVVKSIYFDKPGSSNWFVAYHQDLTISVDRKLQLEGYGPWTVKQDQFGVQPPLYILRDNFTIRIHLDETLAGNGALRVIPGSHLKDIYRPETIDWSTENEAICNVPKGGIMIMKPLLLHSSGRTTNNQKRRVIHVEFSRSSLPAGLNWSEFIAMPSMKNDFGGQV